MAKKLVIEFDRLRRTALFEVPTADPEFGRADYPLCMMFSASLTHTEYGIELNLSIDAHKARIYAAAFAQLADELDAESAAPAAPDQEAAQ